METGKGGKMRLKPVTEWFFEPTKSEIFNKTLSMVEVLS
jgi:hypothetical protein